MKKYFLVINLLVFISINSYSQWASVLNSTSTNTNGVFITVDNQGNIYSAGSAFKNATEKYNYFLVKYDPLGDTLWTRTYNRSNENDHITKILVDNDNNVIVTGTSYSTNNAEDIVTLKYNSDGELLKSYIFDGTDHLADKAVDITTDTDGNYYICGSSRLTSQRAYVLIKTNNNLEKKWAKTFTAYYGSDPKSISFNQTNQQIAITGYLTDWENDYFAGTIVYDSSGTKIWDDYFQQIENNSAVGFDVHLNTDQTVYICGYETNASTNKWEAILVKYNSNGDTLWTRKVSPEENTSSHFNSLKSDDSGNIFITGMKGDSSITVKYTSEGNLIWMKQHYGKNSFSTEDTRENIKIDNNGDVLIAARSYISAGGGAMLIKYTPTGEHVWTKYYNESASQMDEPLTFDIDESNNSYVIINSRNINNYIDMATVQFTPEAIPTSNFEYINNSKLNIYPNPSTGIVFLSGQNEQDFKIKVYSLTGSLLNEFKMQPNEKYIDLSHLTNGFYFIEINNSGEKVVSKQLIQR